MNAPTREIPLITFSCPDCKQQLSSEAGTTGRHFDCPNCGQDNVVPGKRAHSPPLPSFDQLLKFSCGHCGQKLSCEPEMAGETVRCPACAQPTLTPGESETVKTWQLPVFASSAAALTFRRPLSCKKEQLLPDFALESLAGDATSSGPEQLLLLDEDTEPRPSSRRRQVPETTRSGGMETNSHQNSRKGKDGESPSSLFNLPKKSQSGHPRHANPQLSSSPMKAPPGPERRPGGPDSSPLETHWTAPQTEYPAPRDPSNPARKQTPDLTDTPPVRLVGSSQTGDRTILPQRRVDEQGRSGNPIRLGDLNAALPAPAVEQPAPTRGTVSGFTAEPALDPAPFDAPLNGNPVDQAQFPATKEKGEDKK